MNVSKKAVDILVAITIGRRLGLYARWDTEPRPVLQNRTRRFRELPVDLEVFQELWTGEYIRAIDYARTHVIGRTTRFDLTSKGSSVALEEISKSKKLTKLLRTLAYGASYEELSLEWQDLLLSEPDVPSKEISRLLRESYPKFEEIVGENPLP